MLSERCACLHQVVTPNGTAIYEFRKARNLSLRTTAQRAEIHHSYLRRIERGESAGSPQVIRRIAEALAVPPAAINREEAP